MSINYYKLKFVSWCFVHIESRPLHLGSSIFVALAAC